MCNISGAGRAGRVTFVKKLIVHPKKNILNCPILI